MSDHLKHRPAWLAEPWLIVVAGGLIMGMGLGESAGISQATAGTGSGGRCPRSRGGACGDPRGR